LIELVVVAEGQTEESFVRDVLAPELAARNVFVTARMVSSSPGHRGGALSGDRVLRFMRNALRERSDVYVTTFFDLYGLRTDFPGVAEVPEGGDLLLRCAAIEQAFAAVVVAEAQCRPERFLPHVQPHEFEALVFADVEQLAQVEPGWQAFAQALSQARAGAQSPEHINDGPETHPAARLKQLRPRYDKVLHGSKAAARIGLTRIREQCRHFDGWLSRIEALHPL